MAIVKIRRNELRKRYRARDLKRKEDKGGGGGGREGSDKWENVCAICDDGGDFVCCEGGCLRAFHPTKKHAGNSICRTLKLTEEQWKLLEPKGVKYICENCKYKQHQCFDCEKLGSSDSSSGAEVFQCKDEKCGHFYHPKCVSRLLYRRDGNNQAVEFEQQVAAGQEFLCPVHKCVVCKGTENKDDEEMQFAVCRRCPTVYHQKCLPRYFFFKGNSQRVWRNVLPGQILIYCKNHEIVPKLGTPKRNHIIFPNTERPKGRPKEQGVLDEDHIIFPNIERPKGTPNKQDVLGEDELLHHSSSEQSFKPSESPEPPETENAPCFSPYHRDSFAPKSSYPHPHPGSCGWLDE